MRMIATGIRSIICPSEEDTDNIKLSFVEDNVNSYPSSFHSGGATNEWLSFWLFLVASSYFLLSKQVNYFRVRNPQEKVYLSNTTSISNKISENDVYNYSEISDLDKSSYMDSLLSLEEEDSEWLSDSISENPSSPLSYISADSFTDISEVYSPSPSNLDSLLRLEQSEEDNGTPFGKSEDRASYMDSLLSLEEEDSEYWLSDSMTENPPSPISYISADSFTDVSEIDSPSYWDSLLRLEEVEKKNGIHYCGKSEDRTSYMDSLLSLEEEDSEWLSDSISENPSSPLSYISADSFTDISEVYSPSPSYLDSLLRLEQSEEDNGTPFGKSEDRASYMDSLLSLEEEDSEYWLSDSMTENPPSPISYISADSFTDVSEIDSPSYWDSLLRLEEVEKKNGIHYCGKSEDRASYMDSLLSLEEEDSEYWLSDSMSENPSSPLSYISADSFTDISEVDSSSYRDSLLRLEEMKEVNGTPYCGKSEDRTSYMDSLLSLEEEDSVWLSDSMTENPSSPISYISTDSFTDISDVDSPSYWDSLLRLEQSEKENGTPFGKSEDRACYMESLLSLEEEDSEYWLSDSMSENPSSPISYISTDSFTDISDIDSPSYWNSLLKLEQSEEENGTHFGKSEDNINNSTEHLLETTDIEEHFTTADEHEPLFWPYEGKFNWDSEESSFCTSPRRSLDSNIDLDNAFEREYFALDQIETLMGLKEFDGHEGLDSEFNGDIFVLEESLQ